MISNIADYQYLNGLNTKSITLVLCIRNAGILVFIATLKHFYKHSQRYLFKKTSPTVSNILGHSLKPTLITHVLSIEIASNRQQFLNVSHKCTHLCVGLKKSCCLKWQLIKILPVFHLLFAALLHYPLSCAPLNPSLSAHSSWIGSYGAKTDTWTW